MKSQKKTIIIILSIFTILAIATTAIAIYFTNQTKTETQIASNENIMQNTQETETVQKLPNETNLTVLPTNTYNQNQLKVEYYYSVNGKIKKEDELSEDEIDEISEDYVSAAYIQINGLKNKNVENKINNEIKAKYTELSKKYKTIQMQETGNFADMLSIYIEAADSDEEYKQYGLNFRLDTGEHIKFEDLFINSAPIKNILTTAAQKRLAMSMGAEQIDTIANAKDVDYTNLENKLFEMMQHYEHDEEKQFYISPDEINIMLDSPTVTIKLFDIYDQIAMYKRYLSPVSLYENDNIKYKGLFAFTDRTYNFNSKDIYYYQFGKVTDNLFVDIAIKDYKDKSEKVKKEYVSNIKSILEKVKNMAEKNKDNKFIYVCMDDRGEYDIEKNYNDQELLNYIASTNREYTSSPDGSEISASSYSNADDKITKNYYYYNGNFIEEEEYENLTQEEEYDESEEYEE